MKKGTRTMGISLGAQNILADLQSLSAFPKSTDEYICEALRELIALQLKVMYHIHHDGNGPLSEDEWKNVQRIANKYGIDPMKDEAPKMIEVKVEVWKVKNEFLAHVRLADEKHETYGMKHETREGAIASLQNAVGMYFPAKYKLVDEKPSCDTPSGDDT